MRIVVNDIAASKGGAMSVLKNFYQEIVEKEDNNEWIFLLGSPYLKETENIKVYTFPEIKKSWIRRLMFDFTFGRKIVNQFQPDLYLSLQNTATLGVKAKQLVYLHQSLPYQKEKNFSFFNKSEVKYAVYQKIIGRIYNFLLKHTNSDIIVQTKWMYKKVSRILPNKVLLIPPKINLEQRYDYSLKRNPVIFFYPAANLLYKNHEVIFEAVDLLVKRSITNFIVVLTIDECEVKNKQMFDFLGNISQDDVFNYYQKSILLFTSYIETYGLPLKEAQYFETPIIASKTEFSTEILDGYPKATLFDKYDSLELSKVMQLYITNKNSGTLTHKQPKVDDKIRKSKFTIIDYINEVGDSI